MKFLTKQYCFFYYDWCKVEIKWRSYKGANSYNFVYNYVEIAVKKYLNISNIKI